MGSHTFDPIHAPTPPHCINQYKNCTVHQDHIRESLRCTCAAQFPWLFWQEGFEDSLSYCNGAFVMALVNRTML